MIPLLTHSHFSLLQGVASPEELVQVAHRLGYARIALTDVNNLYGLWEFLDACRREEPPIAPIIGAELTEVEQAVSLPLSSQAGQPAPRRAVLLVEDETGFANLCRLLTCRHLQTEHFQLEAAVRKHAAGLTVLTANLDLLAAWREAGLHLAATVSRRPGAGFHELRVAAQRLGVPLAAMPDSFFLEPGDYEIHRVLRAIALNTSLSRLRPADLASPDAWLAGPGEYVRRFDICPEALSATEALAERCVFTGPDTRMLFKSWRGPDGQAALAALREAAYAGAQQRYGADLPETVVERLEYELRLIAEKSFADYFLVVRDIVNLSLQFQVSSFKSTAPAAEPETGNLKPETEKPGRPRICGRGSGAASLVAYCLGITNVCPIKFNLYFERFLNPGRTDPPDIDVDFAWDERDAVLAAVLQKHAGHAAMVCNHVLFQPRMALREVAKVFGLPDGEITRVTHRLPSYFQDDAFEAVLKAQDRRLPELLGLELPPPWPEIVRLAERIAGAPRYLSVHPGGVVITSGPLDAHAPLEMAAKGVPILQWEKDGAETRGLVKIDLLGNRSLGVIRDTLKNLAANGISFDELHWEPEDDPDTQALVARGETMGCFYIESPAMRLLQRKTGKGDYAHLVIHSSIIRPAANEYITEYVARLRGKPWRPLHPLLEDVLAETYGIMVYQEDVSKAAMALAGFDHVAADRLRKILSKKDKERHLPDFQRRFEAGARSRGVGIETIRAVWRMMMSFAGYSFCKPHSASYARVSFQAAYLKAHHAAEFMAAVLGNEGGFYSTFAYVSEARRLGLIVLPPDVNASQERWQGGEAAYENSVSSFRFQVSSCARAAVNLKPETSNLKLREQRRALRAGFQTVKALSAETGRRIIRERQARPFADLPDFLNRVNPGLEEARALIHAGAFDSLNPEASGDRAAWLWELACWRQGKGISDFGFSIFDLNCQSGAIENRKSKIENLFPPGTELERLRQQFAVLGFLCDRHPMVLFAEALKGQRLVKAAELPRYAGQRIQAAGWPITAKPVSTRKGEPMEFRTFEDETGLIETVFFPEAYRRFCHLTNDGPCLLGGRVEEEFGAVTLTVDSVQAIRSVSSFKFQVSG